jgi:hypothetical protein
MMRPSVAMHDRGADKGRRSVRGLGRKTPPAPQTKTVDQKFTNYFFGGCRIADLASQHENHSAKDGQVRQDFGSNDEVNEGEEVAASVARCDRGSLVQAVRRARLR